MSGIETATSPITKEFQEMLNAPIEGEFECLLKGNATPTRVVLVVTDGKISIRVGDAIVDKAKFLKDYAAVPHVAGNAMQNAYKIVLDARTKAHLEKK